MRISVATAAAVAGIAVGSSAMAGMVSHNTSVPIQTTNWNTVVSLPLWNPALYPGQTLVGVKLKLTGTVEGDVRAESLDASASTINAQVSASITATAPSGLLVTVLPLANTAFNATAFDGTIDFGGTSGFTLNNLTNSAMNMGTLNDPPDNLAPYIGVGMFGFPVSGMATSTASGAGNIVSSFRTEAGVEIEITYTYVPAPGAAALLGMGGLIAGRRRRN